MAANEHNAAIPSQFIKETISSFLFSLFAESVRLYWYLVILDISDGCPHISSLHISEADSWQRNT
jgi:hypothetical protein